MRKILSSMAVWLILASVAAAAEIHGTITEGAKPLSQGVVVKVDCGGASASGKTDQFGSYSVKVAATGDCRLTLDYKGASPSLKVVLYDKPTRYDLQLKEESGKLTLTRK
jgi:hypothetical protein